MNIVVFDTETISIDKPFCYNIGYLIADSDTQEILLKREFVVEQIWHNNALFSTAYYEEKRPLYISRMKGKKIKMDKFGYICQQMARDFEDFNVQYAFAFNSTFDERVFNYNCEWFKCVNPFDNIPIRDIRGFVHHFIAFTQEYQDFCEKHELFTESGNYSTNAENVYNFVSKDVEFKEEHTALADSEIEYQILMYCVFLGGNLEKEYKTYSSIPRKVERQLTVIDGQGTQHKFAYKKKTMYKKGEKIVLKN